ncbi:MAG: M48 family metallopeptidase [Lamprocystis purpurea]|uniref:M48 family metallopeptidase n=1 Tax=Lamprocystis purpurea TaxID=61598 RepID=UPI00036619A1|nr:SprT family zinc-dependent metalloprotease [Lamprocystis purpurea]MBV5273780.1 M48 family metallopeptidase [Lamprocystis purpurea]
MAASPHEDRQPAHLDLPDGQGIDFEIRSSDKARSLRLKISARDGLTVTAPRGIDRARVMELVASKAQWIADRLTQFDTVRQLIGDAVPARPQAFDLPALAESWRVEYRETRAGTVGARTDQPGRVVVVGAVEDLGACQAALRRWLARRAKETLGPWLAMVAQQTGLRYTDWGVKNQRTRWGSCTRQGCVSLNCKLLFLNRDQVRYVMVHELCHTLELNHSIRYWALLRQFEPKADVLHGSMRDAWTLVPAWAQRGSAMGL